MVPDLGCRLFLLYGPGRPAGNQLGPFRSLGSYFYGSLPPAMVKRTYTLTRTLQTHENLLETLREWGARELIASRCRGWHFRARQDVNTPFRHAFERTPILGFPLGQAIDRCRWWKWESSITAHRHLRRANNPAAIPTGPLRRSRASCAGHFQLVASSTSPVPTYRAIAGYGQSGMVLMT